MNAVVRKEIEDLIVSGRKKTEEEFDCILDEYFRDKSEKDKNEIGDALSDFFSDKFGQLIEVEYKLDKFRLSKLMKKPVGMPEMAF